MTVWIIVGIICAAVIVGVLQGLQTARDPNAERLARLEQRVSQIAERLGIEQSPLDPQVQELIMQGRKINAIKLYREQTGVGLREAKEAVDSLEAQIKVQGLV